MLYTRHNFEVADFCAISDTRARACRDPRHLYYPYTDYPYLEWYADNGRVVLELDPFQLEIVEEATAARKKKTPEEQFRDEKRRDEAFASFMAGMVNDLSRENRKQGGDGNVTGIVAG